jgi:hypothetical protein
VLRSLIIVAGVGQLLLVLGSLAIPRILNWNEDLRRVRPLTRQVFWTYAAYIWTTNVCFGLVGVIIPGSLLDGSRLAIAVCGFITLYWLIRIVVQFAYFDRSARPPGNAFKLLEFALVGLFVYLTLVHGLAVVVNLGVEAL